MLYELTPERRAELIEEAAQRVHRYRLYAPAVLFLESLHPVVWIGAQAAHFISPVAGVLFPKIEEYAFLMEDRRAIEDLVSRIEILAREDRDAQQKRRQEARAAAGKAVGESAPEKKGLFRWLGRRR